MFTTLTTTILPTIHREPLAQQWAIHSTKLIQLCVKPSHIQVLTLMC